MKTLADMTEEEQFECVGMWCDYYPGRSRDGEPQIGIFAYWQWVREEAIITRPDRANSHHWCVPKNVTPRFDLPRAWMPDGTPVKGEWVEGHMWWGEDTDTLETVDLVGAECLATGQVQGFDEWPDGVTPGEDVQVRRFITEWEEIP